MKSTCSLSPSAPSSDLIWAALTRAVGQTSGHWVKPKNISTTLPLKSSSVRTRPSGSLSWKPSPKDAPDRSMPCTSCSPACDFPQAVRPTVSMAAHNTERKDLRKPEKGEGIRTPVKQRNDRHEKHTPKRRGCLDAGQIASACPPCRLSGCAAGGVCLSGMRVYTGYWSIFRGD